MRHRGVTIVLLALPLLGAAVWAAWPAPPNPPDWSDEYRPAPPTAATDYDLTPKPAPEIEPGTVVGTTAPRGWSHLVIKSLPRIRADQRAGLHDITIEKAAWMFTAFLADVTRESDGTHTLKRLGLGLGAKGEHGDTVVTSDTARKSKVSTGPFGGMILDKGYAVQRRAVLPLWSPGFGLLDTPVWFRCDDTNRLVRYRYALLLDRTTGKLDVLMWSLGADGPGCGRLTEVVKIAPNTIDAAELVVDRRKAGLLFPDDDAFAVDRLPPGVRRPLTDALRELAGTTSFTTESARELETRLRDVLREFPP